MYAGASSASGIIFRYRGSADMRIEEHIATLRNPQAVPLYIIAGARPTAHGLQLTAHHTCDDQRRRQSDRQRNSDKF